jgi:hypothetical protein
VTKKAQDPAEDVGRAWAAARGFGEQSVQKELELFPFFRRPADRHCAGVDVVAKEPTEMRDDGLPLDGIDARRVMRVLAWVPEKGICSVKARGSGIEEERPYMGNWGVVHVRRLATLRSARGVDGDARVDSVRRGRNQKCNVRGRRIWW